ncbi:restriction endonuclease subunit S [Mycobacterium avium]|uniref:restriction endonuclease subunit S n=1 Tax=Mycobacterium avium TaxID=1764 RepID=UPI00115C31B7|nr:restriction endonuclease subunit S [Mycobacterium avium]
MKTVELGEICTITMGQAPRGDSYNDSQCGLPLIAGAGDFAGALPSPKKYTTAPSKISRAGDIILGIRASIGDRVWSDREYCLGRGVAGLRAESALDSKYLWHWLGHSAQQLAAKGRGATFLQVNRKDIASMKIALPPLDEQRRVAAVLDHADHIRTQRQRVVSQIEALPQAAFNHVFGESLGGPTVKLGEVAEVASGITKGRRTTDATRPVPYLAVVNVQAGRLNLSQVKEIDATEAEIARYTLSFGDLVLTEGGDPDKLGRGTVWREQLPICIHQNHIFRVRVTEPSLDPEYLSAYLASRRAKDYFLRSAKQTTGIASINMTQLRATPIYLPPLDAQERYLRQVRKTAEMRETAEAQARTLDDLFASLQSRAFSGQL